jgi:hypothetical protein
MYSQSTNNLALNINTLSFDSFDRDPNRDIVCVAPVRTIVRREEEILLIRRIRKVEDIDAGPACPVSQQAVAVNDVEKKTIDETVYQHQ